MGKAAQYWNNYIGEVISKSKPVHPDSVKSLVCLLFSCFVYFFDRMFTDLFIFCWPFFSHELFKKLFTFQEKPKKITSAGVGPRGLSALKSTFENKVSIQKDVADLCGYVDIWRID